MRDHHSLLESCPGKTVCTERMSKLQQNAEAVSAGDAVVNSYVVAFTYTLLALACSLSLD